jgi:hypothetical protein
MKNDEEDVDPGVGPSSSSNIAEAITTMSSTSHSSPMAGPTTPIEADDVRLQMIPVETSTDNIAQLDGFECLK